MEILGIIPARSGSKGIKNKNLRKISNKPLLQYSIDEALRSTISRVIVSTDDPSIAKIAKKLGADVPFLRPKKFATDKSTNLDVINHAVRFLEKQSYFPDIIVLLQPTSPFRTCSIINKSISKLKKEKSSSVISVRSVKDHPLTMFKKQKQFLKPYNDTFLSHSQRQSRPLLVAPSGLIYTFWTKNLKKYGNFYGTKVFPLLINDPSLNIDIDSIFDLFMADMTKKFWSKYKNKFN